MSNPLQSVCVCPQPATLTPISVGRRLARVMIKMALWPARVMQARRDMAVIAQMNHHELRDIGLTEADVHNVIALPLDEDPTKFLAAKARTARANRHWSAKEH